MCSTKSVALFLLGIYLILQGIAPIFEATPGVFMQTIFGLLGIASGVLFLVSIGLCHSCRK